MSDVIDAALSRSHHLIAPELVPILGLFPDLPLSDAFIAKLRGGDWLASGFQRPELPAALQAVECREVHMPGIDDAPDVRILLYTPPGEATSPRPAILHIHGGGYVMGNPEINDASNRATALAQDCVIASVDYRLAPETIWPGALQDCYAALGWLHDEAGIDTNRIAVAGESAGGGHAAALALHARSEGAYPIRFLLLDSPMLDDRTGAGPDQHPFTGEFVWTPEKNQYGWRAMLGMAPGGPDVPAAAVPARAETLDGMPATFINVGALDLFVEESLEFARRLARAGVPIELHVTPGVYHGGSAAADTPLIASVLRLRAEALKRIFGS